MRLTDQEAKALLSKPGIRVSANSVSDVSDLTGRMTKVVPAQVTLPEKGGKDSTGKPRSMKQTKCEMEYGRMLAMEFPGASIIPWGITLRMANGHKYTPDYLVMLTDKYLLVEVKQRGKNGFRQNSYQRAKLAYDQCREEFKLFSYRWAEKHNGSWSW